MLEKNSNSVWLLILLSAALGLRLYGLGNGLWYDEIWTLVHYVRIPFKEIITTYDSQNNHILFSLLSHAAVRLFGESAWSLRLPAVLFGVGSIWALYLFGREVGSVRDALFSSALLAFSYHHIWFSQNARGYTGLLFWTLLAGWLFVRGLREERPRNWLWYAVTAALGVYTHLTMLFVVFGHFLIYLIELVSRRKTVWPGRWNGFFMGFCVAGLLTILLYSVVLPQIIGGTVWEGVGSSIHAWKNPIWTLLELVKGMRVGFAGSAAALVALIVFGAGLKSFYRENPVVIQLLIFPAFISAAIVVAMGRHLWPRFFFFTMGFGALILIRGARSIGDAMGRLLPLGESKTSVAGTLLCSGLILVSAVSVFRVYAPKQDYEGALRFVEQESKPGDVVVTVGMTTFPYKDYYKTDWRGVERLDDLDALRASSKQTWLLYTMPLYLQAVYPQIMESIGHDFNIVKEFYGTLGGGTIFVCRSRPSLAVASQI